MNNAGTLGYPELPDAPKVFSSGDGERYAEKAVSLFKEGCNCAQAVFTAFCDKTGFDRRTALMLSSGFGGGMGRLREVCGAVSGMVMTASAICGYDDLSDHGAKSRHYALVQHMCGRFREQNGSIVCRELLGLGKGADDPAPSERTAAFYKRRPCAEYVRIAARIICETFAEYRQQNTSEARHDY